MKYKQGDKVLIRSDLVIGEWYGRDIFVKEMINSIGEVVTLEGIYHNGYYTQEYGGLYTFTDEMIERKIDAAFKIRCTESEDDRFTIGKDYYVEKNGYIVRDIWHVFHKLFNTFSQWYESCGWYSYAFELVEDYITKEENEMSSNGKLNKGIENLCVQDVYKVVTDDSGKIIFNPIKMKNLCFVKFDGNDKVYTFNNPSDKRLKEGTKVAVKNWSGKTTKVTVVGSIKIQDKYVKDLFKIMTGEDGFVLKNILGVYETETVEVEKLIEIGHEE